MAKTLSAAEMRKMSAADLQKDVASKRNEIAKAKIGVAMGSHKETAHLKRDRKDIARMLTVLKEMEKGDASALKTAKKSSKVSAPSTSK